MGKLPVQCIISITVSLGPFAQYTLMPAWHVLFPLVYHILRICYSLQEMRTRRSSVLAPFGRPAFSSGLCQ